MLIFVGFRNPIFHEYVEGIQEYAEANTKKFYLVAERGAIEKHLHFQGMVIVKTSTLPAFRKSLYKAMGFGASKDGLNATPPIREKQPIFSYPKRYETDP